MVETLIYESPIGEDTEPSALLNWKSNKNQRNLRSLIAPESLPEENVSLIR